MAYKLKHNPMDNQKLDYAAVALSYMKNPEESLIKIANILADELEATARSGCYDFPSFLEQAAKDIREKAKRGEYTADTLLSEMAQKVIHIQQVPENRYED
jgi:hypothetical protein